MGCSSRESEGLTPAAPKPREKNLFDHLQEFIPEESINCTWTSGTMQCWAAFTHHMERFTKRLKYTDFDEAGLNRFVRFLRIDEGLVKPVIFLTKEELKMPVLWQRPARRGDLPEIRTHRHPRRQTP